MLSDYVIDLGVVVIANLVNLLMIGVFLLRAAGRPAQEHALGWVLEALALPTLLAIGFNIARGRGPWMWLLPALLVAFLALELLLDYVLQTDFRHTRMLGPYLGLYYVALMGLIGYAFIAGRVYGFITLATYFLNLIATGYSYARVGHGEPARPA